MRTGSGADGATALAASRVAALAVAIIVSIAAVAGAQEVQTSSEPAVLLDTSDLWPPPISAAERREWMADEIFAPKALAAGVMIGTWQTAVSSPREWQGSSGFTRRVLASQADHAIAKGIEGGLGALWGEDPRSTRSGRHRFTSRLGYAMKTVVLAPRRDGHLAPAWGRFAGAVGSNVVQNTWLPSRLTTPKETALRIASSLLGRLASNVWLEFWPDLRRRLPLMGSDRQTESRSR